MGCYLWMGDIVKIATDAIVNAANTELTPTPGISKAIFDAADTAQLKAACRRFGYCAVGHAVVTPSYGLPARSIIHVAGPGWFGNGEREQLLLGECYRRALDRALASGFKSVAVPLMFSGEYHIPREKAIRIAGRVITDFLSHHGELDVVLVLYKPGIFHMAQQILGWEETQKYEKGADL